MGLHSNRQKNYLNLAIFITVGRDLDAKGRIHI